MFPPHLLFFLLLSVAPSRAQSRQGETGTNDCTGYNWACLQPHLSTARRPRPRGERLIEAASPSARAGVAFAPIHHRPSCRAMRILSVRLGTPTWSVRRGRGVGSWGFTKKEPSNLHNRLGLKGKLHRWLGLLLGGGGAGPPEILLCM